MDIRCSFAGATPHTKTLASAGDTLYYLSSSNLIVCDSHSIQCVRHFSTTLSCITVSSGSIALGDTTGSVILNGEVILNVGSKILDCCFVGGLHLAFCTLGMLYVVNRITRTKLQLKTDETPASVAAIDGKILVGTNLGLLQVYEFTEGSITLADVLPAHLDSVRDIKVQDNLIATCSQDSNLKIWRYVHGRVSLLQTLNGHFDWINAVCWDGDILYSASADKTVRVWSQDGDGHYACSDLFGAATELLSVGLVGGYLMMQTKTGGIDRISEGVPEYFISGHQDEVTDLDWRGDLLVSCSTDRTTRLFSGGRECMRAQIHGFPMTSVRFMPEERLKLVSSAQETILRILEATQTFFATCEECLYEDEFGDIESYVKSAYLAELSLTSEIGDKVCDEPLSETFLVSNVFREIQKVYGHYFEIKSIAVSSDLILSCNRSAVKKFAGLFVWSLEGKKLQYLEEHDLDIQRIAVSPDDAYAATAGRDHLVCLYAIEHGTLSTVARFTCHERVVWDCGFSRDSKLLATCSRDGRIVLYDVAKREVLRDASFSCEVTSLSFSPRSNNLIAGTSAGELLYLDYDLKVKERLKVVSKAVSVVRFDESGEVLAVGGADGLLRILSVALTTG